MLLINYFRWIRRWRMDWQADNWREELDDAYKYLIEWQDDKTKGSIEQGVKIGKARQEYRRYAQRAKIQRPRFDIDYSQHPAYIMVAEIDKIVYDAIGVHVVVRHAPSNWEVQCYVGKAGKERWVEPVPSLTNVRDYSEVVSARYETIQREPYIVSFSWSPYVPERDVIYNMARDLAYRWEHKEAEFQAKLILPKLKETHKEALATLAESYRVAFNPVDFYDFRLLDAYKLLAHQGLCEMQDAWGSLEFYATEKTRLIAEMLMPKAATT
jgi:hypothetical protein